MLCLSHLSYCSSFFHVSGDHRYLHSFPTRRSSDLVSVLRNRASPGTIESNSFELPLTVFTNSTPFVVVIADMDQDGKPDLVLVADTMVTVLRNVSTGPGSTNLAFANPVLLSFPQGQQPINLAIGDMDGDGRPDIIAHGAGVMSGLPSPSISPI